jgi:hypothetical protein
MSNGFNIDDYGSIGAHTGPIYVGAFFGFQGRGATFMEAIPQSNGASLMSFEHEVTRDGNGVYYYFKLTNHGDQATSYTLAGGGF